MVIFEICHFLVIPGPFEYFSENGWSQKIKVFLMKEQSFGPLSLFGTLTKVKVNLLLRYFIKNLSIGVA